MNKEPTCMNCKAFVPDEENEIEEDGICILNPPQMFVGKDPETQEDSVLSLYPQVNGSVSRCLQLILKSGIVFLLLACCSCSTNNSGQQSWFANGMQNFWAGQKYKYSPEYRRDHIICRTRKNAYQQIITECR